MTLSSSGLWRLHSGTFTYHDLAGSRPSSLSQREVEDLEGTVLFSPQRENQRQEPLYESHELRSESHDGLSLDVCNAKHSAFWCSPSFPGGHGPNASAGTDGSGRGLANHD
jgi:hypothetical protein